MFDKDYQAMAFFKVFILVRNLLFWVLILLLSLVNSLGRLKLRLYQLARWHIGFFWVLIPMQLPLQSPQEYQIEELLGSKPRGLKTLYLLQNQLKVQKWKYELGIVCCMEDRHDADADAEAPKYKCGCISSGSSVLYTSQVCLLFKDHPKLLVDCCESRMFRFCKF